MGSILTTYIDYPPFSNILEILSWNAHNSVFKTQILLSPASGCAASLFSLDLIYIILYYAFLPSLLPQPFPLLSFPPSFFLFQHLIHIKRHFKIIVKNTNSVVSNVLFMIWKAKVCHLSLDDFAKDEQDIWVSDTGDSLDFVLVSGLTPSVEPLP